jgi:hypothetical protein
VRNISHDPHGACAQLNDGFYALLEPAINPAWTQSSKTERKLVHTLSVPLLPELDSLRNPRLLRSLSVMAARTHAIENHETNGVKYGLQSTQLAFDLDVRVKADNIKNKRGRYVEIFDGSERSRKGRGRIRIEDNLAGNWAVTALSEAAFDGKTEDAVFSKALIDDNLGRLDAQHFQRAGDYEKLLDQIDTRRLLLLTRLDARTQDAGLEFQGRTVWRDPIGGQIRRVWVYYRKGRNESEGAFLYFLADLPGLQQAEQQNAHPLVRATIKFRLRDGAQGGVNKVGRSDLAFDPSSFVELPSLFDDKAPKLMLPRTIRAYADGADGRPEEQFSAVLLAEFDHEPRLFKRVRMRCGYNVPGLGRADTYERQQRE